MKAETTEKKVRYQADAAQLSDKALVDRIYFQMDERILGRTRAKTFRRNLGPLLTELDRRLDRCQKKAIE